MGSPNFAHGLKVMGMPIPVNTQGKAIYVKPNSGSDSNSGLGMDKAVKTLTQALALATAHQNDTVYLVAENDAMATCTDWQSSVLAWNKDMVHLVGIGNTTMVGKRARIGWLSTATVSADTALVIVSANGCNFENVAIKAELADANCLGALEVTGERNHFLNCEISGILTNTQDATGAYSLSLNGGSENTFDGCYIGADTIGRGTASNSEILLKGGATRNIFRDCYVVTFAEANTHQFLIKGSSGIDRFCMFDNCVFYNPVQSTATTMLEAFDITAGGSPNGMIIVKDCMLIGCPCWEADVESGEVYIQGADASANSTTVGIATNPESA